MFLKEWAKSLLGILPKANLQKKGLIMKRNLTRVQKLIISIIIILVFISLIIFYLFKVRKIFSKEYFVNQAIQISDVNQVPVFKIDKILLYSNAGAIDNTESQSLKDIDISQFSDISIYIDNKSYIKELTNENTVKSLRIDNIEILSDEPSGVKSLTYKNPLNYGKFSISEAAQVYNSTDNLIQCAPIDYNIIYKNEENANFETPSFYTDCTNPITLGFLNKNIVTHYSVPDNNNIAFNGNLLRQAGVDLNSLASKVNFRIVITNNNNQEFIYNIKLDIKLEESTGIYENGYIFQEKNAADGKAYNFFHNP